MVAPRGPVSFSNLEPALVISLRALLFICSCSRSNLLVKSAQNLSPQWFILFSEKEYQRM